MAAVRGHGRESYNSKYRGRSRELLSVGTMNVRKMAAYQCKPEKMS